MAIDKVGLPTGELQFTAGTPHQHNAKRIGDQFPEQGGYGTYLFHIVALPSCPKRFAGSHRHPHCYVHYPIVIRNGGS